MRHNYHKHKVPKIDSRLLLLRMLCLSMFVLPTRLTAQVTLLQESFESDGEGSRYTSNSGVSFSPNYIWDRTNQLPHPHHSSTPLTAGTGLDGTFYWAAEDVNNLNSGALAFLELNPINVLNSTGLEVQIARGLSRFDQSRWENDDIFTVEYNMDNTGWQIILLYTGSNAAPGVGGITKVDLDNDTGTFGPFGLQMPNALTDTTLTIPVTGNSLKVRVTSNVNGSEEFGFDNIRVLADNFPTTCEDDITNVAATTCDPGMIGVVRDTLTNFCGADSIVITTTTLLPSDTTNIAARTCDMSMVGVMDTTFTNQFGCDSVVITTTTLLPSDTTNIAALTCDRAMVGVMDTTFMNQFGCDSVVITTTTLLPSDTTRIAATTCDSSMVGVVDTTFMNQFGCDSVIITTTTLLPQPALTAQTPEICEVDASSVDLTALEDDITDETGTFVYTKITGADDLFISEYVEGSGNNKGIEIFNATGVAVNLSDYSLRFYFNGNTSIGRTFNLSGMLANGATYLFADVDADFAGIADHTEDGNFFNGDDVVALAKTGTNIDIIGKIGEDPSGGWGAPASLTNTINNTLRRKQGILSGDTNGADDFDPVNEWDGFANNTFDGLGEHPLTDPTDVAVEDGCMVEVEFTNQFGCAATTTITYTVNPTPELTPQTPMVCAEDAGSVDLTQYEGNLTAESGTFSYAKLPSETVTDLFFSEYVEGSNLNKALEIYNGTGGIVDLADYSIRIYFNGSDSTFLTIDLFGSIADCDVFVLADDGASFAADADQLTNQNIFNGDDAIALVKSGNIIDVIGRIGEDPGGQWGSLLTSTENNTLRRKSSIAAGDADGSDPFDPADEWDGFAEDTFDGLGSHEFGESVVDPTDVAVEDGFVFKVNFTNDNGCVGTSTLTFMVEVCNQPPEAVCQDITIYVDSNCEASFDPADLDGGSTDPDGDDLTFSAAPSGPFTGKGMHVVVLTVSDGDLSDTCSATISVLDSIAPIAPAPPADLRVQCADDVPAPVDLIATDNCDGDITVSPSAQVTPGECANDFVMVRTWTFTDACGNSSSVSQTIMVKDTIKPTWVRPLPPRQLEASCGQIPPPATLMATDNCDAFVPVVFTEDTLEAGEGFEYDPLVIRRRWTATDSCGNRRRRTQIITVIDCPDACDITGISVGSTTARMMAGPVCNGDGTYDIEICVQWKNNPIPDFMEIEINGTGGFIQIPIDGPQDYPEKCFVLENLPANGRLVTIFARIGREGCTWRARDLFRAPDRCDPPPTECDITDANVQIDPVCQNGTVSTCIMLEGVNLPADASNAMAVVGGAMYPISQYNLVTGGAVVCIEGLPADGGNKDFFIKLENDCTLTKRAFLQMPRTCDGDPGDDDDDDCDITGIRFNQAECNRDGTYDLEFVVTYNDMPAGQLAVEVGHGSDKRWSYHTVTGSPQTIIITGLPAVGGYANVFVKSNEVGGCTWYERSWYRAPSDCGRARDGEFATNLDQVRVYPNPSEGKFFLLIEQDKTEMIEVAVSNAVGQVVNRIKVESNREEVLDLDGMPEGIYTLRIMQSDQPVYKQIQVQR